MAEWEEMIVDHDVYSERFKHAFERMGPAYPGQDDASYVRLWGDVTEEFIKSCRADHKLYSQRGVSGMTRLREDDESIKLG